MKVVVSVFLLCLAIRIQGSRTKREAKYPRFDRSCYRNMPPSELNECLKFNFQQNLPSFRSAGIPGIINGSIDPHYWPKFTHYFGGSLIQGSLSITDTYFWGWSNMRISDVRANVKNPQKMLVDMDWKLSNLDVFGQFKLEGRIGPAKFAGAGPFTLNLTGVSSTWKVTGSREKGSPYMEIKSLRSRPKIDTFKLKASNAAIGNERLGNLVVATINSGWRIFQEIANPAIDREWSRYCTEKLNQVFLKVPYDELFPSENPTITAT